ncbi:MAG TPA: hypothetical protein VM367_15195 [Pseudonocardia sp.]|jgi:hypothetical protein|nr:hypothetical protein [Pseudonocardia sp.]
MSSGPGNDGDDGERPSWMGAPGYTPLPDSFPPHAPMPGAPPYPAPPPTGAGAGPARSSRRRVTVAVAVLVLVLVVLAVVALAS